MAKTHRFRKVYFICEDNQIFNDYQMVNCFHDEAYVRRVCKGKQRMANEQTTMAYWPKGKPAPILTVHGFYLVHESLFEEILKKHTDDAM